eukprot:2123725-Rhodomonas_salina.1
MSTTQQVQKVQTKRRGPGCCRRRGGGAPGWATGPPCPGTPAVTPQYCTLLLHTRTQYCKNSVQHTSELSTAAHSRYRTPWHTRSQHCTLDRTPYYP